MKPGAAPTSRDLLRLYGPLVSFGLTIWFALGLLVWKFGILLGLALTLGPLVAGVLLYAAGLRFLRHILEALPPN